MYKVAIVDDEFYPAKLLQKYMNDYVDGFEVVDIFSDGVDFIKYLMEHKDIDVVMTDIKMKKMSGIQLAEYIYTMELNIEVILVSAYSEFEYAKKVLKYGVFGYLVKVVDVDELVELMEELKKKLDSKRNDYNDDIPVQRKYFIEKLLSDSFDNSAEISAEFRKCEFPADINELKCTLFTITFDNDSNLNQIMYKEGKDKLVSELEGIVKCALSKACIMYIMRDDKTVYMISIDTDDSFDSEILENVIRDVFECPVKVDITVKEGFEKLADNENIPAGLKKKDENEKNEQIINKALSYINDNYNKDISRDDVAKFVGYTPAYFGKIFKETVGSSYIDYVYRLKMNKAEEFLKSGMKTFDVCHHIGYSDERNFRRTFRSYTGMTPSEYRQKYRKKD